MNPKPRRGFFDLDTMARQAGIKREAARQIVNQAGIRRYQIGHAIFVENKAKAAVASLLRSAKAALAMERADLYARYTKPVSADLESFIADKVYLIRCEEFVKIGYSNSIRRRLLKMQTANPFPLEIVAEIDGGEAKEEELHRRFQRYRIRGEWFRIEGDLAAFIDTISTRSPASGTVSHDNALQLR